MYDVTAIKYILILIVANACALHIYLLSYLINKFNYFFQFKLFRRNGLLNGYNLVIYTKIIHSI